jgi:2',3'-cyclic-nucleotide 2'-phosphodiesterase (5'-nucleotidase family)
MSGARTFLIGFAALVLLGPVALAETVTLVHVNDFDRFDGQDGAGGFAPYAAVLSTLREERPNVIATNGGDMISPSLLSGIDKGEHMITLNNAVGLDLASLGNHEFDFGPDIAEARVAEAEFPFLSANVTRSGQPFPGTREAVLVEVGEFKLGFFGLTTEDTVEISSPGPDVAFEDPAHAAERAVAGLREQGADVIVAIAHLGLADDRAVADVDGVDVILSGHDHEPTTILLGDTLIHKSGSQATFVGVITLELERVEGDDGPEVAIHPRWEMIPTRSVEPAPEVQAAVEEFQGLLDAALGQVIGRTETGMDSRRTVIRAKEAAIGNLIADAMREATGAEIALTNGGGIRAEKVYPAGAELKRSDVLAELPFGNKTVTLNVTGAQLLAALENGFGQVEELAGRFPHVSGMAVAWDSSKPAGERVVEVRIGGEPLDPASTYTMATNDFLARGGDGYVAFADVRPIIDPAAARLMATQVIEYVEKNGTVAPTVDGRIVDSAA